MAKHSKYKGLLPRANDYMQDIKDFGANVRKYREARGLSLDALGDLIDSDKSAVSKLENGDRIPKYDTVLKLADALQITPAMLSPNRFSDAQGTIALASPEIFYGLTITTYIIYKKDGSVAHMDNASWGEEN